MASSVACIPPTNNPMPTPVLGDLLGIEGEANELEVEVEVEDLLGMEGKANEVEVEDLLGIEGEANEVEVEVNEVELEVEKLQRVDMSWMFLDNLPNPAANMTGITKLDLSNNNLENIPESLTARLLNVVVLNLQSNQLRSLPNSLGCLSKLKVLNVSGNFIESLPKSIEDCRALEELIANFNKLTKLPETIGFELTNLQKLAVNSNKLALLPSSISHMTSLRILDARLNCLRALPDGLENLIRLEALNVSQNFHHLCSLPYSLGLLVSLTDLDISYNRISTLPDSMGCLTKLRRLSAEGNPLICPPTEVVDEGVEAVRDYLSARMLTDDIGVTPSTATLKKKSWLGKLVRCGTFGGRDVAVKDKNDGFLLSDYRPIEGLATPRYAGVFSPRRFLSPFRASPRK